MKFKRGKRSYKKRTFSKKKFIRKAAKRRVSSDFVTIAGSYLIRTTTQGQRTNQDWFYGQTWRYNDIMTGAYTNDPVISNMFASYEFCRLVTAKIKVIGCMNPTRDSTTIGYSAIAVDPRAQGSWTPSSTSLVDMTKQHKFCKVRAYPGNNSMKINAVTKNVKECNMAIWQNSPASGGWYTDYKSAIFPPEYRLLIETTGGTYANNSFMGYIKVSYKIQFKNLKRFT